MESETQPQIAAAVEPTSNRRIIFWIILIVMLVIDQVIKAWVRHSFNEHQSPGYPWPGVFELTLTYNQGIAFGMMQGKGWLFMPIALLISAGAGWYSWKHPRETAWAHVAMGLLAAGALGNLYDRWVYNKVTDMFWFRAIDFPVFNWADACITVATCILILVWSKEAWPKKAPAPPAPSIEGEA